MSEKMIEKSCADFAAVLASKAPVPGGGGAAALVGALGTALCSMVGNLTVGRKKYAQYEADVKRMLEKGSVTLVSDVGCGALCCAAALESASMNIFVNTKTLLDREAAAKLDDQADAMLREYMPRARKVADEVNRRLRG